MDNDKNRKSWPVKEGITITNDVGIWTFVAGSAGSSNQWPEQDFCLALAWIVQQLHLGNFEVQDKEEGEVVSVLIGRGTTFAFKDTPQDEVIDEVKDLVERRNLSVRVAGSFAQAREKGIEPKYEKLAEKAIVAVNAQSSGSFNTELHYAFQLIGILRRIKERTLVLHSPPILGKASRPVVEFLGEATRCHLYGFHQACVAICRACLEQSLKDRVPRRELRQEQRNMPRKGELECLISAALRLGFLDGSRHELADQIRKHGNNVLHRALIRGEDSWDILQTTRDVVSYLFRDAGSTRTAD